MGELASQLRGELGSQRKNWPHGTHSHATRLGLRKCNMWVPNPEQVGDLCYNGYWGEYYLVLETSKRGNTDWYHILWLGRQAQHGACEVTSQPRTSQHCTTWDWLKDEIVDSNLHVASLQVPYSSYDFFMAELVDRAQRHHETKSL